MRKGAWTEEEDSLLRKCIKTHGQGKWHLVPARAGLDRCRKSCRLRWLNYLQPNINRGNFSRDEVDLIVRLHNLLGNRWSIIGRLAGRTGNDVKNYWNTHQGKKSRSKKESPAGFKTTSSLQERREKLLGHTQQPKAETTPTPPPRIKVFKPRPRIFVRRDIIASIPSSSFDKSTPTIPNNNDDYGGSFKRKSSNESITEKHGMESFDGVLQNDDKEVGASWPEQKVMQRFWSEEIPTFLYDGSNALLGDGGSNNYKEPQSIPFWDVDVNDESAIDNMDIWGLLNLNYTQDLVQFNEPRI